jgi:hypothetical protein
LKGLFDYRAEFHRLGIEQGFQSGHGGGQGLPVQLAAQMPCPIDAASGSGFMFTMPDIPGFLSSTLPARKWLISLETGVQSQTTKRV